METALVSGGDFGIKAAAVGTVFGPVGDAVGLSYVRKANGG